MARSFIQETFMEGLLFQALEKPHAAVATDSLSLM